MRQSLSCLRLWFFEEWVNTAFWLGLCDRFVCCPNTACITTTTNTRGITHNLWQAFTLESDNPTTYGNMFHLRKDTFFPTTQFDKIAKCNELNLAFRAIKCILISLESFVQKTFTQVWLWETVNRMNNRLIQPDSAHSKTMLYHYHCSRLVANLNNNCGLLTLWPTSLLPLLLLLNCKT